MVHTVATSHDGDFLALARTGHTRWWRWVLGVAVVLFCWLLVGGIPAAVAMADGEPARGYEQYVLLNLSFVALLIGIWLAVRLVHRRRMRTLVTPYPRVRLGRIALAMACWVAVSVVSVGVELAFGTKLTYSLEPSRFLTFLPVVLLLTTIQATTEELLFRGYLLQGHALLTRRVWLLALVNGVLFMLPHMGNTEVASGWALAAAYYFGFGAFVTLLTVRTGTLEPAIGVHVANNLLGALVIGFDGSTLTTNTVFAFDGLNAAANLTGFILAAALFWVLYRLVTRPRQGAVADTGEAVGTPAG